MKTTSICYDGEMTVSINPNFHTVSLRVNKKPVDIAKIIADAAGISQGCTERVRINMTIEPVEELVTAVEEPETMVSTS